VTCGCYHCQRGSIHDQYSDDPRINVAVEAMMYDMTPNPLDRERKPCPSVEDIVHTIAYYYGRRAAKRVYIEVH
jgi:hypothetical protein